MLPNFLVIGAARSGTTSLYYNLCEHPQVFMPAKKELNFFTTNWERGLEWYSTFFQPHQEQSAIGEASPGYTFRRPTEVVQRIAQVVPEAKLIYMLRHPAERTYSHYLHYRYTLQRESRSFWEAIEQNDTYLGGSCYYQWIMRYLEHIERKRMLTLLFDDFVVNPKACLQQIFEFLEVDPSFSPQSATKRTNTNYEPRNQTLLHLMKRLVRSKARYVLDAVIPTASRPLVRNAIDRSLGRSALPEMTGDIRAYLLDYFQEETVRLEAYLGRDLSMWRV